MRYGLIGARLEYSYSPAIHARIAFYPYELKQLAPEELEGFFRKREFSGINVTAPYKRAVLPLLDEIDETARRIGAVNTVVNRNGRLCGYNTDAYGLRALAAYAEIDLSGGKVLILGTGGSSLTARAVAEQAGAGTVVRVSRTGREDAVDYAAAARLHGDARVIINTTPVGMYPNDASSPIDLSPFHALRGVLDLNYHPLRSELVLAARKLGIPAEGGLYMLCAQAVYASALFLDLAEPSPIEPVFAELRREKENIVLIGMPAAGKTTVGRLLARRLHRPFYDTDELFCAKYGVSTGEYIKNKGERAFRALEREIAAEVSHADGCVIALGGGAVLDGDNVRALKRNGRMFFLDRPLDKLTVSADRPLSADRGQLALLYLRRRPVYEKAADCVVRGGDTPEETADAVIRELKQ